jgi:hypothetical protein
VLARDSLIVEDNVVLSRPADRIDPVREQFHLPRPAGYLSYFKVCSHG